jgi:hypothetical protein
MEKLLALGFTVIAGQIDRGGKNYGSLTAAGPVLNAAGEALLAKLLADAKVEPDEKPAQPPKPRKRAAPDPAATDEILDALYPDAA